MSDISDSYDDEKLFKLMKQINIPIAGAIGHVNDDVLISKVFDIDFKTPSLAAEDLNKNTINKLKNIIDKNKRIYMDEYNNIIKKKENEIYNDLIDNKKIKMKKLIKKNEENYEHLNKINDKNNKNTPEIFESQKNKQKKWMKIDNKYYKINIGNEISKEEFDKEINNIKITKALQNRNINEIKKLLTNKNYNKYIKNIIKNNNNIKKLDCETLSLSKRNITELKELEEYKKPIKDLKILDENKKDVNNKSERNNDYY